MDSWAQSAYNEKGEVKYLTSVFISDKVTVAFLAPEIVMSLPGKGRLHVEKSECLVFTGTISQFMEGGLR